MRLHPYFVRLWLLLLVCCSIGQVAHAQQRLPGSPLQGSPANAFPTPINCSFDQLMQIKRQENTFLAAEKKMNNDILQRTTTAIDTIITLPVVFHIIDPNPYATADITILNALNDLNNAFSKTGAYGSSTGVDTKIRFCLAQKAPDGAVTNGINRVVSTLGNDHNMYLENTRLKSLASWDPSRYVNIWVVSNIRGEIMAEFECGVWTRVNAGGYASLPPSSGFADGIVVSGFGSLLAHEMGHYLGLYHTFEGGCTNNNCETDGDKVCDTPPDGTSLFRFACSGVVINSCVTDTLSNYSNGFFPRDTTDYGFNFMDYGNSSCANQFTLGQALRMRAAINTQRTGLLENKCTPPCATPTIARFSRNVNLPLAGETITFTNLSSNATNHTWYIDGVAVANTANFTHAFPSAGNYIVSLQSNDGSTCLASYRDEVKVGCDVLARYYANKRSIASMKDILLDSVLFTNLSVNATSYKWLIRNNVGMSETEVANSKDLTYTFLDPGAYFIRLVAANNTCADTTDLFGVNVSDPRADGVVQIYSVNCYQETKLKVDFSFCNNGFAPIDKPVAVSFYDNDPRLPGAKKIDTSFILRDVIKGRCCAGKVYSVILDIGYRHLDRLFVAFNDSGQTLPISLPTGREPLQELTFLNNVSAFQGFRFRTMITPPSVTATVGDSVKLVASAYPQTFPFTTYTWQTPQQLSCTNCDTTYFIADTTRTQQVVARSIYQCYDTAQVTIVVPPINDYQTEILSISCDTNDSLLVRAVIRNNYSKGVLPKGLQLSFYHGDPQTDTALLLGPVRELKDSLIKTSDTFFVRIKSIKEGNIYASVNDNGAFIRIGTGSRRFSETDLQNNFSSLAYTEPTTPVYVTICEPASYEGYNSTGIYTDRFTIPGKCDSIRILHLTVNPIKRTERTIILCRGSSIFLEGAPRTDRGRYIDTLRTWLGCDSIVTSNVFMADTPQVFMPRDTIICSRPSYTISIPGYQSYAWSTGATTSSIDITQPGTYQLRVRDRNGCEGTDDIFIGFNACIEIQFPNAFTPNGDGLNDEFRPYMPVPPPGYRLQIWNRWGVLLYESLQPAKGWDGTHVGKKQPSGAYVYKLIYKDFSGNEKQVNGTFILIR